jgi:putative FmdB family regulatory protein
VSNKENTFKFNCEDCDEEFKIVVPVATEPDPKHCPFCSSTDINLIESTEIDYDFVGEEDAEEEIDPNE